MIKFFCVAVIFLSGVDVFASAFTCKVKDDKASLAIELDPNNRGVASIDLQREGSPALRIFSRWPMIRGEFTVAQCNPNENEFRDYSAKFHLLAQCIAENMETVFFQGKFSSTDGGKLSYQKSDLTEVLLEFSDCHNL